MNETEIIDNNLINSTKNKFTQICIDIQRLMIEKNTTNENQLHIELNKLLRVMMYNSLEFEYNVPTTNMMFPLQSRFNFNFIDAQRFAASRYMFFQLNTISLIYFCLEQYADLLLDKLNLDQKLTDKTFRNKFNILIHEATITNQNEFREYIFVFKLLRGSFHKGGIYNGEYHQFSFGNISFDFIDGKAVSLSTSAFIFILDKMIQLILDLSRSKKFTELFD